MKIKRHVNEKVEEELEEFKVEIDEKVEENETRFFTFPRPRVGRMYKSSDSSKEIQYQYDEDKKRKRYQEIFKPDAPYEIDDSAEPRYYKSH